MGENEWPTWGVKCPNTPGHQFGVGIAYQRDRISSSARYRWVEMGCPGLAQTDEWSGSELPHPLILTTGLVGGPSVPS